MSGAHLEEIYVKDSSTAPLRSAAEQVRAGEEPERPPPSQRHMCPLTGSQPLRPRLAPTPLVLGEDKSLESQIDRGQGMAGPVNSEVLLPTSPAPCPANTHHQVKSSNLISWSLGFPNWDTQREKKLINQSQRVSASEEDKLVH